LRQDYFEKVQFLRFINQ